VERAVGVGHRALAAQVVLQERTHAVALATRLVVALVAAVDERMRDLAQIADLLGVGRQVLECGLLSMRGRRREQRKNCETGNYLMHSACIPGRAGACNAGFNGFASACAWRRAGTAALACGRAFRGAPESRFLP